MRAAPRQASASRHKALSAESRLALLEALGREGEPLDAEQAGRLVNLHRNTARVHLEQLADAGLVDRRSEDRTRPGRPRILYSAATDAATAAGRGGADPGAHQYRQLAAALAAQLGGSPDAGGQAEQAGRRWASAIPVHPPTAADKSQGAVAAVTAAMEPLGFSPAADGHRIILRSCPFAELASAQRVVTCGVHLGMINQMLDTLDAPLAVDRLDPFVQVDPLLCVVHLSPRNETSSKEGSTR